MNSPRKPWWQQATALVSLGAGGAITGLAFVPGTADQIASPASIPVTLTALDHATRAAAPNDTAVRSAIVGVANYYLRMAQGKTPAEVEALIWQQDSVDGADHGESCAAFASMTLELGAQLVGRQSWVTGGSTYPWPLHDWADVRVDPNPASLGITSILQDAQAHQRWHPLGDGYEPQPGDWVLFDGHVEVVTKYSGDVLSTVGGDSLPNFSVNAHQYPGPLAAQGVVGFVSNGNLPAAASPAASAAASAQPAQGGRTGSTLGASAAATRTGGVRYGDGQPCGHSRDRRRSNRGRERQRCGGGFRHGRYRGHRVRYRDGHPHRRRPGDPGDAGCHASGSLTAPRIPAATLRPRPAGRAILARRPAGHARGKPSGHRRGADRGGGGHDSRDAARHISRSAGRAIGALPEEPAIPVRGQLRGTRNDDAAGVHQSGRPRCGRRAAHVRRPGRRDDRPGHRRIGVGPEHPRDQGQQPFRDQGNRAGGQRLRCPRRSSRTGSG